MKNDNFIQEYMKTDFFKTSPGHPWKKTYQILDYIKDKINIKNGALEIGVGDGKFFIAINSMVDSSSQSYALDIFEQTNLTTEDGSFSPKEIFIANVIKYDKHHGHNVTIIEGDSANQKKYDSIKNCSIISVDGAHHVEYVINDLNMVAKLLDDEGIIIADDFQWPKWISVVEGVVKFLEKNPTIAPFAFGFNKMYFCKISQQEKYKNMMINLPMFNKDLVRFCGRDIIYIWDSSYILFT